MFCLSKEHKRKRKEEIKKKNKRSKVVQSKEWIKNITKK